MHFNSNDLERNFDLATLKRGASYAGSNRVLYATKIGPFIESEVSGSEGNSYEQTISMTPGAKVKIQGECTCPVGHNCKHVVAALLVYLKSTMEEPEPAHAPGTLPSGMMTWLHNIAELANPSQPSHTTNQSKKSIKINFRLVFVLMPDLSKKSFSLWICKGRIRAGNGIGVITPVSDVMHLLNYPPSYIHPENEALIRMFFAMRDGYSYFTSASVNLRGAFGAQLLHAALADDCLYWAQSRADMSGGTCTQLRKGETRHGGLGWREDSKNIDYFLLDWQFSDGNKIDAMLPTEPLHYLSKHSIGELQLDPEICALPLAELQALVTQAPKLASSDALTLSRQLAGFGLHKIVPPPQKLKQITRTDIAPQACLLLGSLQHTDGDQRHPKPVDFGLLAFSYDGVPVSLDPNQKISRMTTDAEELIERDIAAELVFYQKMTSMGFVPPMTPHSPLRKMMGAMSLPSENAWLAFTEQDIPLLREQGWIIEKTPDYRFDVSEVEDWYADVAENGEAGNAWFDLELGIVVNQTRVSLLPVLVQLIRNAPDDFNPKMLDAHLDTDQLVAALPDGTRVALAWGRIKPILSTLGELYFNDKIGDSIRLPTLDAARLAELESGAQLRWMGGERLRQIGQKLLNFSGIEKVAAPAGLQAKLREYQTEGLAWMQFLREYDLAGILADDMGLGKTIQTLAHILTEKEAGRLTSPALVVAPTSLMGNWQAEAARFAPNLRVLLLHGKERLDQFDMIDQSDLVLTTYALLPRDEEQLRAHRYHLVILDESQYIKNAKSKAAQTATMLPAKHRLCLTGTPLQNHLGELWSQFHFLLPGLLGAEKSFNTDFRSPIEKQGDTDRNALLIRRIKPFLLRRTKDKVAKELPAKTEMVREVELTGSQRDLYETVRLAMDKKVRDEIAKKGVARSHIVILEALLKLRQVCCDPRLVKLGNKKNNAPSAKLVELMELIETLLDEGRKILVFSQFTSMLALIEAELQERAMPYALLTGDTQNRSAVVNRFQSGEVPLFLISLKAGGVGLNLTAADTVIHYDPWWNPAAENQATDRAWRIGQDKPVFVYKLIAKGTLEEKIQEMQKKKSALADAILVEGEAQNLRITQEDLQAIFEPL